MNYTKVSKPFSHWLANLDELDGWLYVSSKEVQLLPRTICHCISMFSKNSLAEEEAAESEIYKLGLVEAYDRAGIEMVIANLEQQLPNYNQAQCAEALNYYWKNDAYQVYGV